MGEDQFVLGEIEHVRVAWRRRTVFVMFHVKVGTSGQCGRDQTGARNMLPILPPVSALSWLPAPAAGPMQFTTDRGRSCACAGTLGTPHHQRDRPTALRSGRQPALTRARVRRKGCSTKRSRHHDTAATSTTEARNMPASAHASPLTGAPYRSHVRNMPTCQCSR